MLQAELILTYILPSNNKLLISSINATCFDSYGPSSRTTVQDSHVLNRIFECPVMVFFTVVSLSLVTAFPLNRSHINSEGRG